MPPKKGPSTEEKLSMAVQENKRLVHDMNQQRELLNIVSHDLKNPLSSIDSSLALIEKYEDLDIDEKMKLIKRSRECAQMAMRLVHDLLDVATLESGMKLDLQKTSLLHIMQAVLDSLNPKIVEKKIELTCDIEDLWLESDYSRMMQLLSNIIDNAIKFSDDKGKIHILAELKDVSPTKTSDVAHHVHIKIEDQGKGIPPHKLETIFKKFEQVDSTDKANGTGLGLAISKLICDLHKGQIWVESNSKKGSTFHIVLPKANKRTMDVNSKPRVMLIDDNEDIHLLTGDAVEELGYELVSVYSGQQALEILSLEKVDIILLDLNMQPMDGYEILQKIRDNPATSSIPVLIHTSSLHLKNKDLLAELASDYIQKPATGKELEFRLRSFATTKSSETGAGDSPCILIVDDSEETRSMLKDKLKSSLTCKVITAKNGFEALFMCDIHNPEIVIGDLNMPTMDGIEMFGRMREKKLNYSAILITADESPIPQSLTKSLGIEHVMHKPIRFGEMIEHTKRLIKQNKKVQIDESGFSILLVDDAPENRFLLTTYLKHRTNWSIKTAEDGEQAIEQFAKHKFDIILMDVHMPKLDGLAAISRIREIEKIKELARTPVIALTANANNQFIEKCLKQGYDTHMTKPALQNDILQIIHQCIDHIRCPSKSA